MRIYRLIFAACAASVFACKPATDAATPAAVVASPSPLTLTAINATQQLTVTVNDANGDPISGGPAATFSSNASGVASVSASGLVTAVANGTATITVTKSGLNTTVTVTVAQAVATIQKLQGEDQTGVENTALPTALRVKVRDAGGTGVPNVAAAFAPSGGGSVATSPATTNAAGEAQVTWTLGPSTQTQQVTVTAGAAPSQIFGATAVSATALTIVKFAGDSQTVLVSSPTNRRPAVRITNAGGPVAGIGVTFTVTSGGGGITGSATINTNANGVAEVASWVAGGSAGPNRLRARATSGTFIGADSVAFAATAQTAQYNIVVRAMGPALSAPVQLAFDSAEAYWERVIYGDLSDITFINQPDVCFTGNTMNETIDDIVILARFDSIDGVGLTLGSAGDCGFLRTSNGLTMIGQMRFDTADVAGLVGNNTLQTVILHEMGHVLGFSGFRFDLTLAGGFSRDCMESPTSGTPPSVVPGDTHFKCARARALFDSIGGGSFTGGGRVPLENCAAGVPASCGGGNYNGHWRELTFDNELMTGYIDAGVANPMSVLTIALFEDLGYIVNYAAAAAYARLFSAPSFARGEVIDLGNDIMTPPRTIMVDDRSGTGRVGRP